jgi:hypothetical protein
MNDMQFQQKSIHTCKECEWEFDRKIVSGLNPTGDEDHTCKSCGVMTQILSWGWKPGDDLPDGWQKMCRGLPDNCWRPSGVVFIWDSERVK